MNSKPLPQVITIDYWWDKTKSTQGRYRVLMATGLVLCCLFVFSLLAIKLLLEFLGFLAHIAPQFAWLAPDENQNNSSYKSYSEWADDFYNGERFCDESPEDTFNK